MIDYPLVSLSQLARVSDISFFGGEGILSLDIKGRDFTGTNAVLINGYRSPTFVVISDTRLLADIPVSELSKPISTLNVLKTDIVSEVSNSIISFEAVQSAAAIPTENFLVQKVLKYLFTTRGSDIFSPSSGGGLLGLIGAPNTAVSSISAKARVLVRQAVNSMIEDQADSSAPPEAKVQSVQILSVSYSRTHTSLDMRLEITSVAGQRVVAGLSV